MSAGNALNVMYNRVGLRHWRVIEEKHSTRRRRSFISEAIKYFIVRDVIVDRTETHALTKDIEIRMGCPSGGVQVTVFS